MNRFVDTLSTPSFEYNLISPMLIVVGGAILGVLVEAFVPRSAQSQRRKSLQVGGA